jgi:GAF domain-containing protein
MSMQKLPPRLSVADFSSRFSALSLRAKLTLGNTLIAFAAILAMGYYVYYRAQQSSGYLTAQFEENVRAQARNTLNTTVDRQADAQSSFFSAVTGDIVTLKSTTERLLVQEGILQTGNYWDARLSLSQLPNGSWDNSNSEAGSVFIPARPELTDRMVSEINTTKLVDFVAPSMLQQNPDIIAVYFGGTEGDTLYYPNVDLANLVPPDFDVTGRPWFVKAAPPQNPGGQVVWSDPYLDAAQNGLVITSSAPILDATGRFRGVAAMDIQLKKITDLVAKINVGQTGYAMLIDSNGRLIAMPEAAYQDLKISPETFPLGEVLDPTKIADLSAGFPDVFAAMGRGESGLRTISISGSDRYVVYRPIPAVGYSLAIIVPVEEMLAQTTAAREQIARQAAGTLTLSMILVLIVLALVVIASLGIGTALTSPLERLTLTAKEFAMGNLGAEASVDTQDEIGTLAGTLNTMAATLRGLVGSLEERVSDRTRELERQTLRLKAAAEVARDAASANSLQELLDSSASLIRDRFELYHTGIFLLDQNREFAVLRASPTEAGSELLAAGHRLRVGEQGIVGRVALSGEPRIALDTGADSVFFNNPLLPDTRSEMALPLKAKDTVIGVLDIQSERAQAFSVDDIAIMQVMADQLATAIERARLLEQVEQNLAELERSYGQFTDAGWKTFARTGPAALGYRYDNLRVEPVHEIPSAAQEALDKGQTVRSGPGSRQSAGGPGAAIPIRLRGQVIGVVNVQFQADHSPEETIGMIEQAADRLASALENARLVEETRQRAQRDALVGDVGNRMRSTLDLETVLRTAAQELQKAFQLKEAEVRLGAAGAAPPPDEAADRAGKNGSE